MSKNIIGFKTTKEAPTKKQIRKAPTQKQIHKAPTKKQIHKDLCDSAHKIYLVKNADYGDSYAILRNKYKDRFPVVLIRLEDKMNRLSNLMIGQKAQLVEESIDDTLLDLACYCLMEITERKLDKSLQTSK